MTSVKKKDKYARGNQSNAKDDTLMSPQPNEFDDSTGEQEDDNNSQVIEERVPTVQQMYFESVEHWKNLKGHKYFLYLVTALLIITIYNASNEQNSDRDMNQVSLNINLSDDFESYQQNNPEEFHFNFTRIFIEYQKIQYENTQSSSARYYTSLFDKYVFGSVQDGQIINEEEQKILNQCIEDHQEIKQNVTLNINRLRELKEHNQLEETQIIRQEVEEMEQYLKYRNSTLSFINKILNKTTLYYDYYQYTFAKINTLALQLDTLDSDIIRNELDIIQKNIIIIDLRSFQEEKEIIDRSMKQIILKNSQKLEKSENDLLFEKYTYEDYELRIKVFEQRVNLQQRKMSYQKSSSLYIQLYQEGVKDLISELIESYFRCIRSD